MSQMALSLTLMPEGLDWGGLVLLLLAAFAAGWVDAVVGGGGLIQLPALLLVPGIAPVQALATNKLASVFGTAASSVSYYRSVRPSLKTALPMAVIALLAAVGGASLAAFLPSEVFTPIIMIALVVVALITIFKPALGAVTKLKYSARSTWSSRVLLGRRSGSTTASSGRARERSWSSHSSGCSATTSSWRARRRKL